MILRIILPVIVWFAILLLLTMRVYDMPKWSLGGINAYTIIQFLLFLGFAHILICALKKQLKFERLREQAVLIVILTTVLSSILIEVSRYVFGFANYFHFWNLIFNTLGVFAGIAIFRLVYRTCC